MSQPDPESRYDFAIVGAGMAGASLAAELAPHARVLLIEAEDRPGVHATGRSAAFWMPSYGGAAVLPLTAASGGYLAGLGFLAERGGLHLARAGQIARIDRFESEFRAEGIRLERLGRREIATLVPGLREGWIAGVLEPDTRDIDVAGLHQHYLTLARRGGALLRCRAGLVGAERDCAGWLLTLADRSRLRCRTLVNAAGAWADAVALMAGVRPLGIQPFRRTMVQLRTGQRVPNGMPLILGIDGSFYFKPEGGRLWLTPHDEHPSMPCDAAAEEVDVAIAIDRLEHVVDWPVQQVEHKWAGLRSFAPDRAPVYGRDVREPAFFWFAGQGGFGIQTAPAAARLAAMQLLDLPPDAMTGQLDPLRYQPARFG
jgi:D-arginine dehydrogenase